MDYAIRARCGYEDVEPPETPESIQEGLSTKAALFIEEADSDIYERGDAHGICCEEEALGRVVYHG